MRATLRPTLSYDSFSQFCTAWNGGGISTSGDSVPFQTVAHGRSHNRIARLEESSYSIEAALSMTASELNSIGWRPNDK